MMENALSRLLRRGALICAACMGFGLLLIFFRSDPQFHDLGALTRGETFGDAFVPPPAGTWLRGLAAAQGNDWLRAGLFFLVLLPVARVAFTLAIFLKERDRKMATLAAIVLTALLGSLALGKAL